MRGGEAHTQRVARTRPRPSSARPSPSGNAATEAGRRVDHDAAPGRHHVAEPPTVATPTRRAGSRSPSTPPTPPPTCCGPGASAATPTYAAATSPSVKVVVIAPTVPAAPGSAMAGVGPTVGAGAAKLNVYAGDPHGAAIHASGYSITWPGGHHDVTGLHKLGGELTTVTISGLTSGTPVAFTVRAVNKVGPARPGAPPTRSPPPPDAGVVGPARLCCPVRGGGQRPDPLVRRVSPVSGRLSQGPSAGRGDRRGGPPPVGSCHGRSDSRSSDRGRLRCADGRSGETPVRSSVGQ